jgi:hypothetical protein
VFDCRWQQFPQDVHQRCVHAYVFRCRATALFTRTHSSFAASAAGAESVTITATTTAGSKSGTKSATAITKSATAITKSAANSGFSADPN